MRGPAKLDTERPALVVRVRSLLDRLLTFARRHRWSLPLSVFATISFVQLASELSEDELGPFDTQVSLSLQSFRGSADSLMLALTHAGAGLPMAMVAVLCFAALLGLKRGREATFLAIAAGGTGLLNGALKLLFQRSRPEAELLYLIETPSSFSFPSGHTMGSTGVMLSLLIVVHAVGLPAPIRWLAVFLGVSFIVGVAASRVYFGVHFPSDVVGGLLAGAAWVSAVTGWFYPRLLPGEASTAAP